MTCYCGITEFVTFCATNSDSSFCSTTDGVEKPWIFLTWSYSFDELQEWASWGSEITAQFSLLRHWITTGRQSVLTTTVPAIKIWGLQDSSTVVESCGAIKRPQLSYIGGRVDSLGCCNLPVYLTCVSYLCVLPVCLTCLTCV